MEVGEERLSYIMGYADAYNSKGECVTVNLNQIYDLAFKKFGIKPGRAEY